MKLRILGLLAAMVVLAGPMACVRKTGIHVVYEERYRLFFIKDHISPERIQKDPEWANQHLSAMAGLNRSFEELSAEGFQLYKTLPVGDGGGATRFIFRRSIPEGFKTTNAPMEFTGVYSYREDENSPLTYYVFDPRPNGYTVRVVTEVDERVTPAKWDGAKLTWRDGDDEHGVTLSGDGRSIIHTKTNFPKTNGDITVTQVEAFRLEEPKA